MLDLNYLRQHFDEAKQRLAGRGSVDALDQLHAADSERRAAVTEIEGLKAKRNELSAEVAKAKREGRDAEATMVQSREIGATIKWLEDSVKHLDDKLQDMLRGIPNVPHPDVPRGADESANVEVRRSGEPRKFDFDPKAHWDLGPALGILDFERAAKITGARFAVYWDMAARSSSAR